MTDDEQPGGFRLSDEAREIIAQHGGPDGARAHLQQLARQYAGPGLIPEPPAMKALRDANAAARRQAEIAEARAHHQDELAVASARREERMEQLALVAEERETAAEAREVERTRRERTLYWVNIAGLVFAFIAAVTGVIAIIVTIAVA